MSNTQIPLPHPEIHHSTETMNAPETVTSNAQSLSTPILPITLHSSVASTRSPVPWLLIRLSRPARLNRDSTGTVSPLAMMTPIRVGSFNKRLPRPLLLITLMFLGLLLMENSMILILKLIFSDTSATLTPETSLRLAVESSRRKSLSARTSKRWRRGDRRRAIGGGRERNDALRPG